MDKKKYIRLLRPVKPMKFNALMVYSYLFSRPRRKGYSQRFLADYLGFSVNTIPALRNQLLGLGLICLTPRRRLKAIDPPAEMFQMTKCNNYAYTKVYLPAKSCPLTTKQNAVFWCWSHSKDRGKWLQPKTIARYLGISRNCAKTAMDKAYAYKVNPAHYQDAPQKTPAQIKLQGIMKEMADAKYTEKQILEVMGTAEQDEALVERVFKEAQADNRFVDFTTSFRLLIHKLKKYKNRPIPDQPPTLEELENQEPTDPLSCYSTDDWPNHYWFFGRVKGFTIIEYSRWIKEYSRDIVLSALGDIIFQQPVSVSEFDKRLKSDCHSLNGKV